ncbi:gluconokinase [Acetobacter sp. AN02]|uniref:gluconokinase n=1 Tax=Acetobacter sp. AN02 TaxID=2894186 RepID=UPI0024341BC3|nr:gluconokinase [Acetobacter sp. AN02]MDG6093620.1 gluconokinase [Acetobacter sp. AN02]
MSTSVHKPAGALVVMGVSGSGKSTLAEALQKALGWSFQEGDGLHPAANVEKMSAGIPLTDEDRWPWLDKCRDWLAAMHAQGHGAILSCSALKRVYRERLKSPGFTPLFLYLNVPEERLRDRLIHRSGHYMGVGLLRSQLDTLEIPAQDEHALVIDGEMPTEQIVQAVLAKLSAGRQG